ncbi:MAG: hypothetical protein WCB96_02070 [Candidatus Aminicenantales bacterium]
MNIGKKIAIFLLALFLSVMTFEVFVRISSADELLKLARQAGDHRIFTIIAQNVDGLPPTL